MAVLNRLRVGAQPLVKLGLRKTRAYASAAAAQIDYDYDYYDDYGDKHSENGDRAMEQSEGSLSGRGVQWVIMGDPSVKRHVYAERLSKLLDVPHISMGSLVRQELHPHSSLYKQIAGAVNRGHLVPEEVIFGLLSKRLEEGYYSGESGFILDGIPRTRVQADILDRITDVDLVVNLKCNEDSFMRKPIGKGVYSMHTSGFNFTLQSEGGLVKSDCPDRDGIWTEKLRIYAEECTPLEEYYRKQKKLLDFQVAGAPGESWQGLLAALHLQHINAVNSSQKLTA